MEQPFIAAITQVKTGTSLFCRHSTATPHPQVFYSLLNALVDPGMSRTGLNHDADTQISFIGVSNLQ